MPRKLPPFVECWRDRHGKLRVYGRPTRNGPRVPLPNIGSEGFKSAYAAMLAGDLSRERRPSVAPGSIEALIISYKRGAGYIRLRDTTKLGYTSRLEALRRAHGHRAVVGLTRERIVTVFYSPMQRSQGRHSPS